MRRLLVAVMLAVALASGADDMRTNGRLDVRDGKGFRESWFDAEVKFLREVRCDDAPVTLKVYEYAGRPALLARRTDGRSGPVTFTVKGVEFANGNEITDPVRVDLETGDIFEIDPLSVKSYRPFWGDWVNCATRFNDLPLDGRETLIACRFDVPIDFTWEKMRPEEIVNCLYRPGMNRNKTRPARAAWMDMKTSDFLPFIDVYGQFKYREWPGKTHTDADLRRAAEAEKADLSAHPGPADRNRFGGWASGPQLKATGRFYPVKHEGRWWLVDPEGRLFWSFGAVRVTPSSAMTPLNGAPHEPWRYGRPMPPRHCFFENLPKADSPFAKFYKTHDELLVRFYLHRGETEWYDFSSSNLYRKYGEGYYDTFADLAHRRLRSWGLNTIANSSDVKICLLDRTPYAERIECQSKPIAAAKGGWWKFRDPFDPSFTEGVRKSLEAHGREAHDPWCIGFFVDNEVGWGDGDTDLARWTWASPEDQPAKVEFRRFLKDRGVTEPTIVEFRAFTTVLTEAYFRKTRETLKAFDPGLLYLGCRFCGAPRQVVEACAKYADVVSYNIYTYSLKDWRLPSAIDRPVMMGEFHFGATDRGPFGRSLIGCADQAARAEALRTFVKDALANPQLVGVHWHQFSDQATTGRFDGEYFQVGFTDVCDTPYPETIEALRDVGYRLYDLRSERISSSSEFAFTVSPEPAKGGVADVSSFLSAPAGRDGFVRVENGVLATDAGRFFLNGVNLTGSANFPAKPQAERLARQLAARGVNCVRLHYMDADYGNFMQPPEPGLVEPGKDGAFTLRPEPLDRLDYLVAQLKARGIYVDLNLHVARFLKNKAPLWFDRALIATQKDYARALLCHKNPYTGLVWKDDPALALVELTNEGAMMDSSIMKGSYGPEFVRHVLETEKGYLREMLAFVHGELGVRCPVAGTHVTFSPAWAQAEADFLVYNSYWNHPEVGTNWVARNEAVVNWAFTDWNNVAFDFSRKVKGKPFVITEYGHPWPNAYGAEGQLLIRAYGAFQDIDGAFVYSWQNRSDIEPDSVEYFFSNGSRPDVVCHLPAMAAMFLRRDVRPAEKTIVVPADLDAYCRRFAQRHYVPEDAQTASAAAVRYEWAQVHGLSVDLSGQAPMPSDLGRTGRRTASDTGELVWDLTQEKAGYVTCSAGNVKIFTGFVRGRPFDLGDVRLEVGKTSRDWATVSVLSRDGNGFGPGARVLLAATAGCRNTDAKLTVDDRYPDGMSKVATRGADWGKGPVLCEAVPLRVTFPKAKTVRAWALDGAGARRNELKAFFNAFIADGSEKTVWYELELR